MFSLVMKKFSLSALAVATSADGNPFVATLTVMLFYIMFNCFEYTVEILVWGEHFCHWLTPVFQLCFMGYAGYVVWMCCVYRARKQET